nr:hypothetical protein [Tanacetum cinerariifolium]
TNIFEVSYEDAYDSDVDEGPHAAAAFMANLSSTSRKIEEQLDSNVESDINDNTISYHQYQLDSEVQDVPTEVSSVSPALGSSNPWYAKQAKIAQPTLYDGHALLKPTNTPVRVHDSEESLVQAEVSRTKMSNRPGTIKPINYAELNALYGHFVPQKELY